MISYADIEKANATLKSVDVKGNPYIEVNQRIKAFRMVYPTGRIQTILLSDENGVCKFSAEVGYYTEQGEYKMLGTGTAYEKENSTFINKTSYIENCETSAVGRALGMCGFGVDGQVSSAEEVQNVINNQEEEKKEEKEKAEPKATEKQISLLEDLYNDEELEEIKKWAKVTDLKDITVKKASALISNRKGK